jgi:hypothetical protein
MVKTGAEAEALADDSDQHVDRNGDPEPGAHGVGAGTVKGLDAQVLLDPAKEQHWLQALLWFSSTQEARRKLGLSVFLLFLAAFDPAKGAMDGSHGSSLEIRCYRARASERQARPIPMNEL